MARIITKDDEAHPAHPVRVAAEKALKAESEKAVAAEKALKAESEKAVAAEKADEKKTVKVPERKTE